MRSKFAEVVSEAVENDRNLALFLGDIGVYAFREILERYPSRVKNMGIMEQTMISFAAGYAKGGFYPICHSISPFLVERALEQIKIDFGYNHLSGLIVTVGGTYDYSKLGATHHCPGDIEILGSIPDLGLYLPISKISSERWLEKAIINREFAYCRLSENCHDEDLGQFVQTGYGLRRIFQDPAGTVVIVGSPATGVIKRLEKNRYDTYVLENLTELSSLEADLEASPGELFVLENCYEGASARFLQGRSVRARQHYIGIPRGFLHLYGEKGDLDTHLNLNATQLVTRIKAIQSETI